MTPMTNDGHKLPSDEPSAREVTTEQLRDLLGQITYHWSANQDVMRRTRKALIDLIGKFARAELRRSDHRTSERRAERRKTR
jgi:hypothetical protein